MVSHVGPDEIGEASKTTQDVLYKSKEKLDKKPLTQEPAGTGDQ